MPDNLHVFAPLCDAAVVGLDGADALAFAHAQFASDVTALIPGHWHWSTWLNAKGRVIEVFLLARIDDRQLLLMLPDGGASALAEQLRRFVFRRKLRIEPRPDLRIEARLGDSTASGNRIASDGSRWLFDLGTPTLARTLCIGPVNANANQASTADSATTTLCRRWRQIDLRMGLPRLEPGQREQWTPQQIGLDRLDAYSVRKGCYPGQEIVARTHFLGKAKRRTQLLEIADGLGAGAQVQREQETVGSLVSVADGLALAVLPLELKEDGLTAGGKPARSLPFLDGLAR